MGHPMMIGQTVFSHRTRILNYCAAKSRRVVDGGMINRMSPKGRFEGVAVTQGAEILDWIGSLPQELRDEVISQCSEVSLPVGRMLYQRSEPPSGLYRIIEGRVRLFFLTECGRELLLKVFQPDESIGDLAAVDGQPYPIFTETQTECRFHFLSREKLDALRKRHPEIETALLNYMTRALRTTLRFLEEVTVYPLKSRIASRMTWLVDSANARGEAVDELKIPQTEIALMVGASRQAVNKVLSDLQQQGVVKTGYGAVEIRDFVRLRELGEQSEPLDLSTAGGLEQNA